MVFEDSIIVARINDGDISIFNIKQTEGNSIYVVPVGSTLLVKRMDFASSSQTIKLKNVNPPMNSVVPESRVGEYQRLEERVIACYDSV